ncbi:anti-phage deoxyguanosine triphosphatase [Brucella anthropi]|uniref:anti-phage deoxyguanosine triphosphatase n=1 Tax=Brucella anthropi TaxID=529 RepID=UPI003850C5B3
MYSAGDRAREVPKKDGQERNWRDEFSRDYGRIIHSASFRRLQGKTQVFPTNESDFFRNRLTHSLEVAQIAEGIAEQLNFNNKSVLQVEINPTICATAGLIHDIGHPPFGHNGERALDRAMRRLGGFEGNAQTLRILTRLEKKRKYDVAERGDFRAGFNLCYRTLAAALKYDQLIPARRAKTHKKPAKGYYYSESQIVARIKAAVLNGYQMPEGQKFKTIECSIMDLADDIAYSVYDLEDCLKAEFVTPAGVLSENGELLERVSEEVSRELGEPIQSQEVVDVFGEVFGFDQVDSEAEEDREKKLRTREFADIYKATQLICQNAYERTSLSSGLVHDFITNVQLEYNEDCPQLSAVSLPRKLRIRQQVLKQYTFYSAIFSPRVKMGEFRGDQLVTEIFEALIGDKGDLLMPSDVREMYTSARRKYEKARIVCDFVAGMTDRYAIEFWSRLKSNDPQSIFKPI